MIVESLIATMCIGISDAQARRACEAAILAAGIQSGVKQSIDQFEDVGRRTAYRQAYRILGSDVMTAVSTTAYVYRVARDRQAAFQFGGGPICNSVSLGVGVQNYSVKLHWSF